MTSDRMQDTPAPVSVTIPLNGMSLQGDLAVPVNARGLVVFAHGSGSSRLSQRNRAVAARLQQAGLATLLFDLLTDSEEHIDRMTGHLRFDIPFLATRLIAVTSWVKQGDAIRHLPIGYFGASTGAAAALVAASQLHGLVRAIVSRGGRPDLAGDALELVTAPTLLIVGGDDVEVLDLNQRAYRRLSCVKELAVVPHAGHLFEEPGTLDNVADLARDWFEHHLMGAVASTRPHAGSDPW